MLNPFKHKPTLAILTTLASAALAYATNQLSFADGAVKTNGGQTTNSSLSCRVVAISDGDTLTCLTDAKRQLKVRLHAIDAPEKKQAFGQQAKKHLSDLVYNQTVTLNITDTDRYGRTVADIQLGSLNVNQQMVKDGYAWGVSPLWRHTLCARGKSCPQSQAGIMARCEPD
ncbi:thermonuclease family protein [Kingella oralis]|uniref:thermonuclease family protein n=1 Tax=Kingella oralis TaxID=505 RepID=UPI002D7F3C00|nr:thermonuclease family protein [Kingella oralis]